MRSLLFVSVFDRLKGAAPAAAGLACIAALSGCGSGLHGTASAGVPTSALTVSAAPKLGYAWNETDKTLRPITGVPGSAQFGESVTPAGAYELGTADPAGTFALLLDGSQSVYRMALPAGSPVLVSAQVVAGSTVRISPQGSAALLFAPGASSGTLLTQLSATPAARVVAFAGPAVDAAVSDAGSVAVALKSSTGISVQVVPAAGNAVSLAAIKGFGGMAFITGTEDLLLADSGANSLSRIRSASTSPAASSLSTAGLLKTPVSVAASRAGRWAVVANSADGSVVRVDLSGATAAQRTVCSCQPSVVAQLATDSAFRLTALQDGPVWISDASNASFPVLFIPAVAAAVRAAGK